MMTLITMTEVEVGTGEIEVADRVPGVQGGVVIMDIKLHMKSMIPAQSALNVVKKVIWLLVAGIKITEIL